MHTTHHYSDSDAAYASVGKRLIALIIDIAIISIPFVAVMVWFGTGFGAFEGNPNQGYPADMSADVYSDATGTGTVYFLWSLLPLIGITYFAIFESSPRQATIGKQLVGIKVVNSKGQDLRLMNALLRAGVKFFISGIFFIGYILAFFNDKKQTLHDKWADTYVVNK